MSARIVRSRGILLLAVVLSACGAEDHGGESAEDGAGPAAARSVLLVSFDTTRADRLGFAGHAAARTPVLDRLAAEGAWFSRCYAPAPITLPSHVTMLTGVDPRQHGVRDNGVFRLGPAARSLAEVAREQGMATGGFVGSYVLDARYGLGQGFDRYGGPQPHRYGAGTAIVERPAGEVVDEALGWLSGLEAGAPFFLWVHFYDPHAPFTPPESMKVAGGDDYDAEIAYCDQELGRLLQHLRDTGRGEGLLTLVTADHGESFGEHEEETHGIFVYDATMRVPLVLHLDGGEAVGEVGSPAGLVDLARTALEALGLGADEMPAAQGLSLLPALRGEALDAERSLWLESWLPYYSFRWHPLEGVVVDDAKLIDGGEGRYELYATGEDERSDRSAADSALLAAMQEQLERKRRELEPLAWGAEHHLDADQRAYMLSMGYLTVSAGDEDLEPGLPAPRDRIGDLAERQAATESIQRGRTLLGLDDPGRGIPDAEARSQAFDAFRDARRRIEGVLGANPRDPFIHALLGLLELSLGDHAAAIPALEKALSHRPYELSERFNLALCYDRTGRRDWAEREILKALALEPRFAAGWSTLMRWWGQGGRNAEALFCAQQLRACPGLPADQALQLDSMIPQWTQTLAARGEEAMAPAAHPLNELRTEGEIARERGEADED